MRQRWREWKTYEGRIDIHQGRRLFNDIKRKKNKTKQNHVTYDLQVGIANLVLNGTTKEKRYI